MIEPVTLCGLVASREVECQGWKTAFYQIELAELSAPVAQGFVQVEVDREAEALGQTASFLLCVMHAGHDVERAPRIDWADQDVDEDEEMRLWPTASTWTVCGAFLDNGQAYHGLWVAHGPRMAYATAWDHYNSRGRYLYVADVHPGVVARVPESPTFIDAQCRTEGEMSLRLAELIPG